MFSAHAIINGQIEAGQLRIYIDDTNVGADNYSAEVAFTPRPPATPSPFAALHIDGSDLRLTNASATWIHKAWSPATNVQLNGITFDTVSNPVLPNSGATTFLPPGVDLSTVSRSIREAPSSLAAAEHKPS